MHTKCIHVTWLCGACKVSCQVVWMHSATSSAFYICIRGETLNFSLFFIFLLHRLMYVITLCIFIVTRLNDMVMCIHIYKCKIYILLYSYFFQEMQSYISMDKDFLIIFTQLRTAYDSWLRPEKQERSQKYASVSKKHTLAGTLNEVQYSQSACEVACTWEKENFL